MMTLQLLAPVSPQHLYCIGLNYRRHAAETGKPLPAHPVVFSKPGTAVCASGDAIVVPRVAQDPPEVDFEAELAVVIGCKMEPSSSTAKNPSEDMPRVRAYCKDVSPEEALSFVVGYTAANDVTARRWQGAKRGGGQWDYAKSFDTFCPLGPALVRRTDADQQPALEIGCRLKSAGETEARVMQASNTSDMVFNVAQLVSFLSQGRTLLPGTVILAGTPEGVGFVRKPPVYLQHGDEVEVDVEGVGVLRNPVRYE